MIRTMARAMVYVRLVTERLMSLFELAPLSVGQAASVFAGVISFVVWITYAEARRRRGFD